MTERMENTIRHIKSGVDVDPWAAEEVERVFKAVDEINELISDCEAYQESNDSAYHKEQEKVIVYDKIVELLKGGE